MIRVLYIYPKGDGQAAHYVQTLAKLLEGQTESAFADSPKSFGKVCESWMPDIVHIWGEDRSYRNYRSYRGYRSYRDYRGYRGAFRIVLSPNGTEPCFPGYYAIIARSPLEAQRLTDKGLSRVEIIRNPLITKTISFEEAAKKTLYVYNKVQASYPYEWLEQEEKTILSAALKAAICGDKRWVGKLPKTDNPKQEPTDNPKQEQTNTPKQEPTDDPKQEPTDETVDFLLISIYARLENILPLVQRGLKILDMPPLPAENTACYLPDDYSKPQSMEGRNIVEMLDDIRQNGLTLLRLTDLHKALMDETLDEFILQKKLEAEGLNGLMSSLLPVMQEQTMLDEGFMPAVPADDALTKRLRQEIKNHLRL